MAVFLIAHLGRFDRLARLKDPMKLALGVSKLAGVPFWEAYAIIEDETCQKEALHLRKTIRTELHARDEEAVRHRAVAEIIDLI
jgi:hypothetical protein